MAAEAARLAAAEGVGSTTVDRIADAADVGRATFFRYFESKELAIAEGFTNEWLAALTRALEGQPARLSPMAAVRAASSEMDAWFEANRDAVVAAAELARSSPSVQAWTLEVHRRSERVIAELVAPRFRDLEEDDPRPWLVGALTMATARIVIDRWLADGMKADLPSAMRDAMDAVTVRSRVRKARRATPRSERS